MDQYKILGQIGKGTFGTVFKGMHISSKQIVAIKRVDRILEDENFDSDHEVILFKLFEGAEHIVSLLDYFTYQKTIYLVLELGKMDFRTYMRQKRLSGGFTEREAKHIIYQLLKGLSEVHQHNLIHGDFKPENLIYFDGLLKITDFGSSQMTWRKEKNYEVGNILYRAPECLLKSDYFTTRIDVWALGLIIIEMFTFETMFEGTTEIDVLASQVAILGSPRESEWLIGHKLIKKQGISFPMDIESKLDSRLKGMSNKLAILVKKMLSWNPESRPSVKELLKDTYFSSLRVSKSAKSTIPTIQLSELFEKKEKKKTNFINKRVEEIFKQRQMLKVVNLHNLEANKARSARNIPKVQKQLTYQSNSFGDKVTGVKLPKI